MSDNTESPLQYRMAHLARQAIARIHENRPELRGKSVEQTIMILKMEERLRRPKVSSGNSDDVLSENSEDKVSSGDDASAERQ
jgi:hypothetical protein